jgi:hypothetical protein
MGAGIRMGWTGRPAGNYGGSLVTYAYGLSAPATNHDIDPNNAGSWVESLYIVLESGNQSNWLVSSYTPGPGPTIGKAVSLRLRHDPVMCDQILDWSLGGSGSIASASGNMLIDGLDYSSFTEQYSLSEDIPPIWSRQTIALVSHVDAAPLSLGLCGIAPYGGELHPQVLCLQGAGGSTVQSGKACKVDMTALYRTHLDRLNDFATFELLPIPPLNINVTGNDMLSSLKGLMGSMVQDAVSYVWLEAAERWVPTGTATIHDYYWSGFSIAGSFASLDLDGLTLGNNDRVDFWLPSQMPV